jgi:acyl dehydratase
MTDPAPLTMYFEDFALGQTFHSPSKTVTDAHFLFFAGLTGDNHPIHYDDEYAKQTRFGARVTHGLLLAALTAAGASSLSPYMAGSIVAFIDQSARFLAPVLIGDTVAPQLEVVELSPKTSTGVVKLATRITNQRGEVVLEGHHTYIFKKRSA